MKRFFKKILPARRYKRSILSTALSLIAVLFLMNYLLKISQIAK